MKRTDPTKSILGLPYPVIGLSPMDGVTDSPFRQITKKYGNPDIIFTEFTNVMGMIINPENVIHHFEFEEMERPIVAQIYGKEPEYFYHVAKIIIALGYDAIDINMGCPAKNVTSRGSGAALIQTPDLAKEIIFQVKRGISDWVKDGKLTGMKKKQQEFVERFVENYKERATLRQASLPTGRQAQGDKYNSTLDEKDSGHAEQVEAKNLFHERKNQSIGFQNLTSEKGQEIPTTVKTRIGFDEPVTEWWMKTLSEANPEWISVHGRTLKQMYSGGADWNELKIAVDSTDVPVMTNGDVENLDDAQKMLKETGAFGVLIGRATFGNPWVFRKDIKIEEISIEEKLKVMLEHAEIFTKMYPEERAFVQMRKHFGWYCKGFDGAKDLRRGLVRVKSLEEVRKVVVRD